MTGIFIIRLEEVADILNVSLDHVRALTKTGKLAFHGAPGFYRLNDVLAYKEARDIRSAKALKELVELTEAYGGYEWQENIEDDRDRLIDEARD